jgi:hypothetical protein
MLVYLTAAAAVSLYILAVRLPKGVQLLQGQHMRVVQHIGMPVTVTGILLKSLEHTTAPAAAVRGAHTHNAFGLSAPAMLAQCTHYCITISLHNHDL